jgi:hypothetical protein
MTDAARRRDERAADRVRVRGPRRASVRVEENPARTRVTGRMRAARPGDIA